MVIVNHYNQEQDEMRAVKLFLSQLSDENRRLLIIFICFIGDFINAFIIFLEISDFKYLQKMLSLYSSELTNYADILQAPQFQVQLYQLLIKTTVTTMGLLIFFHATVYFFFLKKKKSPALYLKILTFSGGCFSTWFGLKSLALNPNYSLVTLLGGAYFLAFYALLLTSPNPEIKNS